MKRRHLFRTELKYDFGNRRFYISVLALCAVLLIVALPYRNHLIAFGGSTEGKAWLCIFTYAITSEKALLFAENSKKILAKKSELCYNKV